ncbi:MAG: hypothetical protein Q9164_004177, partial [Protoblastenia rupestris]
MASETNGINALENHAPPLPSLPAKSYDPSTLALHADNVLNSGSDVAPAFHVSSTFRYALNPDELIPAQDLK